MHFISQANKFNNQNVFKCLFFKCFENFLFFFVLEKIMVSAQIAKIKKIFKIFKVSDKIFW